MQRSKEPRNLLELAPSRVRQSEPLEGDREVILVPRFGQHRLGRWLAKRAKQPYHRVTLDEIGSFVWRRLDGVTTVQTIADALLEQYGEKVSPVYQRVGMFVNQLARAGFIAIPKDEKKGASAHE